VEDTLGNRIQAAVFGQYASKNARDYFDNDRKPLEKKQIQEFIDVDMPIQDYWEYREGLQGLTKIGEKADYIDSLDLPIPKKNLLINNISGRKKPIDMTDYDSFDSFEEFDYAQQNPGKYTVSKAITGDFEKYQTYTKGLSAIKADKDANGDTISGSAKKKKIQYINNLDIPREAKLVLYKSQYKSDNTYNYEILQYINSI